MSTTPNLNLRGPPLRMIRPLLGQTYALILFTTFALAALHNVTVDDSVLTGAVVPHYLASGPGPAWNQGNTCQDCAAQPDPAMVYNGTWHDGTYSSLSGPFLSLEFSFTGTALYIYFILANAPNFLLLTAVTSVNFTLDGVTSPPFVHFPTTGAGYQYNVPVFATESLASGLHTMTVQPIVPTSAPTDAVLMLFDYLIYSTDANVTTTTMLPVTTATGSSANPSSPVMSGTAPGPDIGAIVGGTVAGVVAIVLVVTSLLCYWRYKKRVGGQTHVAGATDMVEPFFESQTVPTPFDAYSLSVHQDDFPPSQFGSGSKTRGVTPDKTVRPSVPLSSTAPSASGGSSNHVTILIEEIGMLRGEVSRLRTRQDGEPDLSEVGSVAPPDYFSSES